MPRLLIIPDIHHKVAKADAIVAHEPHDQVIYLGDYQDDFGDTSDDARRTALWLKDRLTESKNVMLRGNHDVSYLYPQNPYASCSGFEHLKNRAIREVLDMDINRQLKPYHIQDGVLFSHAGLSIKLINQERLPKDLAALESELAAQAPVAESMMQSSRDHWAYACGWSRGGRRPHGGLTWCDFDLDFVATSFPQIVGHTPHPHPLFHLRQPNGSKVEVKRASETTPEDLKTNWWALDLDSHLDHYAVIEDGKLTVKEVMWSGRGRDVNRSFEVFEGQI